MILSINNYALAFDPISITAMLGAGVNTLSSINDIKEDTQELSDGIFALEDLFRELDETQEIDDGSKEVISRLKTIENLSHELGLTESEILYLLEYEPTRLADGIRALTRTLKSTKRLFNTFGFSKKGRAASSVYTTKLQTDQLITQNQILNEYRKDKLDRKISALSRDINWNKFIKDGRKEINKSGSKSLSTGLITFPKSNDFVKSALKLSQNIKPFLLSLVLLVFLCRLIYFQFTLSDAYKYKDLFLDTLSCFFLILVFPTVINLIINFSTSLSDSLMSESYFRTIKTSFVKKDPIFHWYTLSPAEQIYFVCESIKTHLFFPTISWVFNIGLALLITCGPIIIFSSTMLNFSIGIKAYLAALILLSLWPFLWNSISLLSEQIIKTDYNFKNTIGSLIIWIIQILSPLFILKLLSGASILNLQNLPTNPLSGNVARGVKKLGKFYKDAKAESNPKPKKNFSSRNKSWSKS